MNLKLNLDTPSVHLHSNGTAPWQLKPKELKEQKLYGQNRSKRYVA